MNDSYVDNASLKRAFVDILLEIAREDKEFRAYLRGILEQAIEKERLEAQEGGQQ